MSEDKFQLFLKNLVEKSEEKIEQEKEEIETKRKN